MASRAFYHWTGSKKKSEPGPAWLAECVGLDTDPTHSVGSDTDTDTNSDTDTDSDTD